MVGWAILAANVGSTLFMTGLIWFVQIVHYPLMGTVPQGEFRRYALAHQRQTTWVVAPLMFIEAVSGFLVILIHPPGMQLAVAIAGFLLIIFIFFKTGVAQVPQHRRLAIGYDQQTCCELVKSNWWRTIAWTIRAAIVLYLFVACATFNGS